MQQFNFNQVAVIAIVMVGAMLLLVQPKRIETDEAMESGAAMATGATEPGATEPDTMAFDTMAFDTMAFDKMGSDRRFNVTIRRATGPPVVEISATDPQDRSVQIACSTCHSVRQPDFSNRASEDLQDFHQGLQFSHGQLACYACHHPDDADALRSADGSKITYSDAMQLCAQCHSKQAESFAHGAHGGMNGYWDLRLGPQTKHHCIDCHDPHAPKFPKMVVDFKPRDRFLKGEASHGKHE